MDSRPARMIRARRRPASGPHSAMDLLRSRAGRFSAFTCLYVAEGVVIGFTQIALVAFLRQGGFSLEQIGSFIAAVLLPWSFKWAWAPLIDLMKPTRLGGRRVWLLATTALMAVSLSLLALVDVAESYRTVFSLVLVTNVLGATLDITIDALAVSTLEPDEVGRGNGLMFGGLYLGVAVGGGGSLYVSSAYGLSVACAHASLWMAGAFLFTLMLVRDPDASRAPQNVAPLGAFIAFNRRLFDSFFRSGSGPAVGLLFALMPCGAMALTYAILGTIQVDYGLEQAQIAQLAVYKTILGGLGSVVGGWLGDRFGPRRMLALFFVLTTAPTLFLASQIATVGLEAVPIESFYGAILVHGFTFGMGFGLRPGLFMRLTDPKVGATQFTALMAMGNLAISIGNYWQGWVAQRFDYATVLFLDAAVVVVPLVLLPFVHARRPPPRAGS